MSDEVDRSVLPFRRPPFKGVADKTLGGSEPGWGLTGLTSAVRKSVAPADGTGSKKLKAALARAEAGLGG